MVGQILKELVKEKGKACTMDGRMRSKPSSPNWKSWCVMIPSTTNVFSWLSGDNQGGYGVVRKVLIERFNYIPSMIELAGKTLKTNDKQEAHKQQSMETVTCTCEHLGVIKFLAIHTETMEAYTLWWNGGTFLEMLDYNMKYSPIIDNCMLLWQGGPNMEGQT